MTKTSRATRHDLIINARGTMYEHGFGLTSRDVLVDKSLPFIARYLYSYLCTYADNNNTAFPSTKRMAEEIGIDSHTLFHHLKCLEASGYITIEQRRNDKGEFMQNVYYIEGVMSEVNRLRLKRLPEFEKYIQEYKSKIKKKNDKRNQKQAVEPCEDNPHTDKNVPCGDDPHAAEPHAANPHTKRPDSKIPDSYICPDGVKQPVDNSVIYSIVKYLNDRLNTKFSPTATNTVKLIKARLKEGYTYQDFVKVIDNKIMDWQGQYNSEGKPMDTYLRPETLFSNKFNTYLNQIIKPKKQKESFADSGRNYNPDDTDFMYKGLTGQLSDEELKNYYGKEMYNHLKE